MPAAAEPVVVDGDASRAPRPGRRALILGAASAVLLAGGGAVIAVRRRQAAARAAAEGDEASGLEAETLSEPRRGPPVFLALDAFVVNLADRGTDRYAQVGITLELESESVIAELKAYMPAIRNGILMVLAHKTSTELLTRAGKEQLAAEVVREAIRPLGLPVDGQGAPQAQPVRHVHFSSFIIQ
jgi:flagellar FliL protein